MNTTISWGVSHVNRQLAAPLRSQSCDKNGRFYWGVSHVNRQLAALLRNQSCEHTTGSSIEESIMWTHNWQLYCGVSHVNTQLAALLRSLSCEHTTGSSFEEEKGLFTFFNTNTCFQILTFYNTWTISVLQCRGGGGSPHVEHICMAEQLVTETVLDIQAKAIREQMKTYNMYHHPWGKVTLFVWFSAQTCMHKPK